ncbi:MAG: hypothetical protein H6584_04570 [Flavobacteriales bacterium]|nr:hypothetical protein [Flavobacteriales bacterium]
MKKLIYIFLFISSISFSQSLETIRSAYIEASQSKEKTEAFYRLVNTSKIGNKELMAYKGAALTMKSKYTKLVKEKVRLFKEGARLLDGVISENPNNLEMRVIRLSIQENVPKFLKYQSNIQEDKQIILDNFAKQSPALKKFIRGYVQTSSGFSEEEKRVLR